jgi:hypothetical protein
VHVFSLSFTFFAAACLMFIAAMILGIFFLPELIAVKGLRSPAGWTIAHMMTLGFMTMLAMGASFQLVQVILKTRLFSRFLGFVQFAAYAAGLAVLLPSFFTGRLAGIGIGGSLVAIAVLLYAFNLMATIIRRRIWNVFVLGMGLSLAALLVTVGLGTGMGIVSSSGRGLQLYDRMFLSHMWFGLGGWMSGLILTFSFKLLPMFYISLKKAETEAWYMIGLFQAGVWLQAASIWYSSGIAGFLSLLCLTISIMLFIRFILAVRKKAKPLNGTIPVVAHMNLIIAVIFELWLVFDFVMRGSAGIREWTAGFAVLLIAGWFTCNILGYLARIVPFLWWAYRFHHGWQKKSKILLKDMVKETRMGIELWIYAAAIGWVAGSIAFAWPPGSVIGLAAALVMAVVYLYELSRAFRY